MNWSKEACKKYNSSVKGKLVRKKYNSSKSYKKISDKYRFSKKGKSVRKKYRDFWYKTEKGRKYSMWASAKRRAKKVGVEFSLLVEDIHIPATCPLLSLKLSCEDFGVRYNSPSLDRKDPEKGYTKENVWVVSSRANLLKNNSCLKELELLVNNLKLCGFT